MLIRVRVLLIWMLNRKRCRPTRGRSLDIPTGSGLCEGQYSFQICVQLVGTQPRLDIICRGKALRISDAERNVYHKHVDLYFQKNAWADTKVSGRYNSCSDSRKPRLIQSVLWQLDCTDAGLIQFNCISTVWRCMVWYAQWHRLVLTCWCWICTASQGVDASAFRSMVRRRWAYRSLVREESLYCHRKTGHDNPLGRQCIQQVMLTSLWSTAVESIWKKRNALSIRMDKWSLDKTWGSPHNYDYTVSPPSLFMPLSSSQPEAETDEPAEIPDVKEINNSGNDSDERPDDAEEERVHLGNFNLVGRRLKALYNNGWFKGDILYFNTSLNKYSTRKYRQHWNNDNGLIH